MDNDTKPLYSALEKRSICQSQHMITLRTLHSLTLSNCYSIIPKELLAISLVRLGVSPENHTYESATEEEDILRAMLCTRVYTSVYPRVYYCVHTCILFPPR